MGRQGWLADLEADAALFAGVDNRPPALLARFWAGAAGAAGRGRHHRRADRNGPRSRAPTTRCWPARLQDLADSVADECEQRERAAEAAAEGERALRAARKTMAAYVALALIESGDDPFDRDLRILTATPRWRWRPGCGLTEASASAAAFAGDQRRGLSVLQGPGSSAASAGEVVRRSAGVRVVHGRRQGPVDDRWS